MKLSVDDPCFMYTKNCMDNIERNGRAREIVCLQTDDTIYAGNRTFVEKEENEKNMFDTKPAMELRKNSKLKFSGAIISRTENSLSISQPSHIEKLNCLTASNFTRAEFISERALGAYIAAVCKANITYYFSSLAKINYLIE